MPENEGIKLDDVPKLGAALAPDIKASMLAAASAAVAEATGTPTDPVAAPEPAPVKTEAKTAVAVPAAQPAAEKPSKGIAEVRAALERQTARVKELEESGTSSTKQLEAARAKELELMAKSSKYEDEIEKTYKPIAQKLTEREKQLQAIEEQMRIRDYTATTEFHDKYEKPLAVARTDAEALLNEVEVTTADGSSRKATAQDFNFVLSAETLNESARRAKSLFGEDVYQTVVSQATRIRQLARQREEGRKNAALESAEFVKRQQQTQAQLRESIRQKMLSESENRLTEFKPADGDDEISSAYREGLEFADKSIAGDPSWTPDQLATHLGRARAEITAANVLRKQVARKDAKIAELETKLKSYESSEPDVTPRNGGQLPKATGTREDVRAKLEDAARLMATQH